ncbi:hypothetical protein ACFWU3_24565 [Streptomyces sp. NPDC058685]
MTQSLKSRPDSLDAAGIPYIDANDASSRPRAIPRVLRQRD